MKPLAILLLVGVFVRHGSAGWLADLTGFPVKGIFYILGGLWEAVLCTVILAVLAAERNYTIWTRLAMLACVAGAIEGAQMGVCRALTSDVSAVPAGANLCTNLTGVPVGTALFCAYFICAVWIIGGHSVRNTSTNPH